MKLFLKQIYLILMVAIAASVGFSTWQAYREESRYKIGLEKRSVILSERLEASFLPVLATSSPESAKQFLENNFVKEDIRGTAFFNADGNLFWSSEKLSEVMASYPQEVKRGVSEAASAGEPRGVHLTLGQRHWYLRYLPIASGENPVRVLALFFDESILYDRVYHLWFRSFLRALLQIFFSMLATLLIVHLSFLAGVHKTVHWIKKIRMGEKPPEPPVKSQALLEPLVHEVSKMAESLTRARSAAEAEAKLRYHSESLWTAERLKEMIRTKLQERALLVVSNREPYMHLKKGKTIDCVVPPSGLVTAIEPILKACGGTWIAQGSGDADRLTVDSYDRIRVPPDEPQYLLRRVWLTEEEESGYYYGFSNEGLWPLCHIAHTRPLFLRKDWEVYQAVNQKFADAVFQEIDSLKEPYLLIQDYHFALLPELIKARRSDARISLFWHIPWPNPESFGICPWKKELILGMLGADLIGFHTQFHCNNFIETVDRVIESRIDREHFTVNRESHTSWVKPFPISVALESESKPVPEAFGVQETISSLLKPYGLEAQRLGIGVDRLDYTKGIVERFLAVEKFLEKYPEYQSRFTFIQIGAPSRSRIPRYRDLADELEKVAERINQAFKSKNWKPILLLKAYHSQKEILPFYRAADVCLVTSLHDGMNLVAKEYVVSRADEEGVLILSQFTGASRELADALIVNPYDTAEMADAIQRALEMPLEEKKARMKKMRQTIREKNVYKWAADFVGELIQIRAAVENR